MSDEETSTSVRIALYTIYAYDSWPYYVYDKKI